MEQREPSCSHVWPSRDRGRAKLKADFKSKSFIALKEARESLYWIDLLHRNGYLDDKQYQSIYDDCAELVKVLIHRCKKINETIDCK